MRSLSWSGRSVVVLASVISAMVVGGVAYAAETGALSSAPARLYACAAKPSGELTLSSANAKCRKGARKITWNAAGLRGPGGSRGAAGPAGATGATGAAGATGSAGEGIDALFGDGSDGSVTISSNTTLTRDMYYANLTISPGVTLNPGGYRIFVAGTLTLGNGSSIARNGSSATVATVGEPLAPGTLGAGSGGGGVGGGGSEHGGDETNSLGGNSGGGGLAGTATTPAASAGGAGVFHSALQALTGRSLDGSVVNGGAGGGGLSATGNGNGGGGGGVVVVIARTVVLSSGAAAITATGGNGGSDDQAGDYGYGGGGGVVVVISSSSQPAGVTLSAAGGTDSPSGTSSTSGFTDWLS